MLKNHIEEVLERLAIKNYYLSVDVRKKSEEMLEMVDNVDKGNNTIYELNDECQKVIISAEVPYEKMYIALSIHMYCTYIIRNRVLEVLNIPIPKNKKELIFLCNEFRMSNKGFMTFTELLSLIETGK